MKPFFKPQDFERLDMQSGEIPELTSVAAANIANRLLRERGKVVYGSIVDGWMPRKPDGGSADDWHTHTGLVICVEEIEREDEAKKLLIEAACYLERNYPLMRHPADIASRIRKALANQGRGDE